MNSWADGPLFGSGEPAATDLPADTLSVSQLGSDLQEALRQVFGGLWVLGEVQRPRRSRPGHLYFQLVEKGRGDQVVAAIDAVLFRTDHQRVSRELRRNGLEITEGQALRCYLGVDFYPPFGRLQAVVRDVDVVFALGDLERRRRETLAWLESEGLLERNAALPLPEPTLRIGLVTSAGSAASEDFLTTLGSSGLPFAVHAADVAVQGVHAERQVSAALHRLGREAAQRRLDAIVLVRGGGSRSDLAAFDARSVAEMIARSPLPVLTGLGHEIDTAVADRVAHHAFKTPTGVAEFLVARALDAERRVAGLAVDIAQLSRERLRFARSELRLAGARLATAGGRLAGGHHRIDALQQRLGAAARLRARSGRRQLDNVAQRVQSAAGRELRRRSNEIDRIQTRLPPSALRKLSAATTALAHQERLLGQLDPDRVLARGFSWTTDEAGRTVRDAGQLAPGSQVRTRLHVGAFDAVVRATADGVESSEPSGGFGGNGASKVSKRQRAEPGEAEETRQQGLFASDEGP